MKASALCHGAATIVNAIASGKGAAFGISLETRARVKLSESGGFRAEIPGHEGEDTSLMVLCAKKILDRLGLRQCGADISTESTIPIAAGLKSSSTAANAVALATLEAARKGFGVKGIDDLSLVKLAVGAALEAGVTVTGAFDDAAAAFLGGYVVTDNKRRIIVRRGRMDPSLKAVIYVPKEKRYTAKVDVARMKLLAPEVSAAWDLAKEGKIFTALNTSGLLYSAALGENAEITLAALEAGAIAAGLSGKGPAVVALTKGDTGGIRDAWKGFNGKVIEASVNNRKAHVLR